MNNADRTISDVDADAQASGASAAELQLAEILDGYMVALEKDGIPPDLDQLAADHPHLADEIRAYGESLRLLHRAVARLGPEPPADRDPPHLEVKRLGDFEIVRPLGRGGMGIVYEARQISLNRPVALKVLPFAAMLDQRQIARFRTEAQAAAGLHHPNIVPVYAIGQERGVHFFAMQFVEGQSLDHALEELRKGDVRWQVESGGEPSKPPAPAGPQSHLADETLIDQSFSTKGSTNSHRYCRSAARLIVQAARALHYAHEFGIVHRDVKPSNLLLDRSGKLWVSDFGLARIQSESGVTVSGDVVGTLRYMSPEQAAGNNALVDARTDVYALGSTLYELLTLRHVYEADNRQELLRQIETREPLPPRKINSSISSDLEAIVLCAMAKSREDRYETAQAMADDLERYLAGEPIRAQRPTALDRVAKWALRHRRAAALAAGLLVAISLLCAVGAGLIAREKLRTEAALADAERNLARAEEHFRQAREVVDQFGNQLAGQLTALPGSEPVRRQLLLDTLQYYREFINHAADDAQLQEELATTYTEAGSIAQQLGDRATARSDFEQALAVFQQLAEQSPENASLRIDRAKCLSNLALLQAADGDFAAAQRRYDEAIGLLRRLPDAVADRPRFMRSLAETYSNLGLTNGQQGHHEAARAALAEAIELLETLAAEDPTDARNRHDLAICYNNLSYIERDVDAEAAARSCAQAVAILAELAEEAPDDLALRSDLALFHNNSGALQGRGGQWDSACKSYALAIEQQRQLVRQAPHVVGYRFGLATSLTNLGQAYSAAKNVPEATEAFAESQQLARELADDYPKEVQFQSLLGGVLNNLAMVEEESGQLDAALENYAAAIACQQAAFDLAPQASDIREFLSKHYFNYGRALRADGQPAEAGAAALARRGLWPGHGQHLYEIAIELALASEQLAGEEPAKQELAQSKQLADEAEKTLQTAVAAGYDIAQARQELGKDRSRFPQGWEQLLDAAAAGQQQTTSESAQAAGL